MEIRDATQGDWDYVRSNPLHTINARHYMTDKLTGWSKTALYDGLIMGVGGVFVFWPGVGEGWYVICKEAENHKEIMSRCIMKMIDLAVKELNLHRLEATIRVDYQNSVKLIETCGFKREGRMVKYTEDKVDAFLYAFTV